MFAKLIQSASCREFHGKLSVSVAGMADSSNVAMTKEQEAQMYAQEQPPVNMSVSYAPAATQPVSFVVSPCATSHYKLFTLYTLYPSCVHSEWLSGRPG